MKKCTCLDHDYKKLVREKLVFNETHAPGYYIKCQIPQLTLQNTQILSKVEGFKRY